MDWQHVPPDMWNDLAQPTFFGGPGGWVRKMERKKDEAWHSKVANDLDGSIEKHVTAVGFEPTPLWTGA